MTKYLEDVIVFLSQNSWGSHRVKTKINLGRNDVSLMHNLAQQVLQGTALTENQYEVSVILVKKYSRQLRTKFGINIDQVDKLLLRNKIRVPKHLEKELRFSEDRRYLELSFPFDQKMFTALKKLRYSTRGTLAYSSADKFWYIYASPNNIKDFVKICMNDGYKIAPDVLAKFEEICKLDVSHANTMQLTEDGIVVGAPKELASALELKTKGMTERERIIYLIDRRRLYGYNLSAKMSSKARELLSDTTVLHTSLMFDRIVELKFLKNDQPGKVLTHVKEYAKLVNRDIILFNRKDYLVLDETVNEDENVWGVVRDVTVPAKTDGTILLCNLSSSNFEHLYLQKCVEGYSDRIVCVSICRTNGVNEMSPSIEKMIYLNENKTINQR